MGTRALWAAALFVVCLSCVSGAEARQRLRYDRKTRRVRVGVFASAATGDEIDEEEADLTLAFDSSDPTWLDFIGSLNCLLNLNARANEARLTDRHCLGPFVAQFQGGVPLVGSRRRNIDEVEGSARGVEPN